MIFDRSEISLGDAWEHKISKEFVLISEYKSPYTHVSYFKPTGDEGFQHFTKPIYQFKLFYKKNSINN